MSAVPKTNKGTQLSPVNLAIGAGVSLFEVTTLGQPLEVLKTHLASHRSESLTTAISKTYAKGGWRGFYAGLVPWAWIESSTTGGILLFASSAVEGFAMNHDIKPGAAGLLGGVVGGAAQAYLAMGVCTCMKTAEITREKSLAPTLMPGEPHPQSAKVPSTWGLFMNTYRQEGIRGINKGVNAVALRQMTNWGSRIGIARAAETSIRKWKELGPTDALTPADKVLASAIGRSQTGSFDIGETGSDNNAFLPSFLSLSLFAGGALGVWNHPIEVVRVEMQSLVKKPPSASASAIQPAKPTMLSTLSYVYGESGVKGLFKGVTPRIGLSVWRTICLVSLGDHVKDMVK
ncbi:hypothetical protein JCM11641_001436 [Rhodosporidiobolus odoratus]